MSERGKYDFSNGATCITVRTVGDLINELKLLPYDLEVRQEGGEGADIVVWNIDTNPFVGFEEGQAWAEEEFADE